MEMKEKNKNNQLLLTIYLISECFAITFSIIYFYTYKMGRTGHSKQLLSQIRNEGNKTKKELKQQMKSSTFWTEVFRTLSLIGFYYVASIGLTFYQSWLLKVNTKDITELTIIELFSRNFSIL